MEKDDKMIMVIDDNEFTLKSISYALKMGGFPNQGFNDPEEALCKYDKNIYELVITDFRMPKLNGIEVLTLILEMDKEAKVIIYSAFADEEIQVEAKKRGAFLFMKKPFNYESLIETIQRIKAEDTYNKKKVIHK
ncbi:MAG: response regulator [Candidatus Cloacimonetes bacterium]|nr:response regulator [Candidatus Cloacimonadota bacterium]